MIFLLPKVGHCIHFVEEIVVNMGKLPRPKSGGMSYYLSRPCCAMLILMRKTRFHAVEHFIQQHLKWNQMESRGMN